MNKLSIVYCVNYCEHWTTKTWKAEGKFSSIIPIYCEQVEFAVFVSLHYHIVHMEYSNR